MSRKGAALRDIALPAEFDRLYEDQVVIMDFESARAFAWERLARPQLLSDLLRDTLAAADALPRARYDEAMQRAARCRRVFADVVADCDALLTPSAPGEAPAGMGNSGSSLFNRTWTLLGVPCVTLPAGRGASGLPLGVQLVGHYAEDARLLLAAEWVRIHLTYQEH